MRRQNAERFPSRYVRWFRAIGLTFTGILLVTASSQAGVINASLTAPITNTGGSSPKDIALYRVYYSTSALPCPGRSFIQIAASTSNRSPNQTVSFQLTGLTSGSTYSVSVTAVYTDGRESACSAVAGVVAQPDISVTPTGPVSFGTVTIENSATRIFIVRNTSTDTIMVTASVPAPFSIDSGSPFTLLGTGATAAVTVRFTPTSAAAASTNVSFTANGETQSRLVTGIGMTAAATKPPLPPATSAPSLQSPHAIEPSNDADDPRAVIDWLLERSSSRRR
jgi:Cep192 domain 4